MREMKNLAVVDIRTFNTEELQALCSVINERAAETYKSYAAQNREFKQKDINLEGIFVDSNKTNVFQELRNSGCTWSQAERKWSYKAPDFTEEEILALKKLVKQSAKREKPHFEMQPHNSKEKHNQRTIDLFASTDIRLSEYIASDPILSRVSSADAMEFLLNIALDALKAPKVDISDVETINKKAAEMVDARKSKRGKKNATAQAETEAAAE